MKDAAGKRNPGPYRVFFTSFDCVEPPHVHVEREDKACKFWLVPVGLVRNHGFDARELGRIRRLIGLHHAKIMEAWRHGMSVVVSSEPLIQSIRVTGSQIIARLVDGRVISVPLAWSWRLSGATPAQRARHRLIGGGQGVHWPDVEEDISVEGMLGGTPARRPRSSGKPNRLAPRSASSPRMPPTRSRAARG